LLTPALFAHEEQARQVDRTRAFASKGALAGAYLSPTARILRAVLKHAGPHAAAHR
jgi:hypothetical protein